MSVGGWILTIVKALAGMPAFTDKVLAIVGEISSWYINQANEATKMKILDAAAMAMRAKNEEQRYAAAEAWRKALSRPKLS